MTNRFRSVPKEIDNADVRIKLVRFLIASVWFMPKTLIWVTALVISILCLLKQTNGIFAFLLD